MKYICKATLEDSDLSPFVRREWIEIWNEYAGEGGISVSLREKGVD